MGMTMSTRELAESTVQPGYPPADFLQLKAAN